MKFYTVNNLVKPHCVRCNKNYDVKDNVTICTEFYGKGKERIQCNGPVVNDSQFDWSYNFLKDYSMNLYKDLRLYDEVESVIQRKLSEVKTGTTNETGRTKINVQSEIENLMRLRGINIINRFNSSGDLVSKSVYILPMGESVISEYGYNELRDRFERVTQTAPDGKKESYGYMIFTEVGTEEPKEEKIGVTAPDDLTCEICGRTFKAKLGLIAHKRKHEREN